MGGSDDRPGGVTGGLPRFDADGLGVAVGRFEGPVVGVGVGGAVGVAPGVVLGVVAGWRVTPGARGPEGEVSTGPTGTVVGTPGVGDPTGVATVPGPTVLPVPPVEDGRPTPVGVAVPDPTGVPGAGPERVDTGGPGHTPPNGDGPPPTTVRRETTESAPTTTPSDCSAVAHPRGRARA